MPWTLLYVTDAFEYLPGSFAQAGIPCSINIVSIQAVPGFNVHSQVRQWNNQSIALSAADAAVIPKLIPAPLPAQYAVKDVPAGADLSGSKTLELCVIYTHFRTQSRYGLTALCLHSFRNLNFDCSSQGTPCCHAGAQSCTV